MVRAPGHLRQETMVEITQASLRLLFSPSLTSKTLFYWPLSSQASGWWEHVPQANVTIRSALAFWVLCSSSSASRHADSWEMDHQCANKPGLGTFQTGADSGLG
jgi:hypothetical protein